MINGKNSFYYTTDKSTFIGKIEALEYAQKNNQSVYFYYYDDVYSKIDWTIEPPGNLDFYYKEQAQRLRDEYDYLILAYSGGADSTNILETFHYNNIKLDKILMVGAFSQDELNESDENHNGELYKNCFPYVKELGLESISQVVDYTKLFDKPKDFSIYQCGDEWASHIGTFFSVHNWFWYDVEKYVVPPGMENKKVGLIFGKDKPFIMERNLIPGFCFWDKPVLSYAAGRPNTNLHKINFYWDPQSPLILIKQLHVLKTLQWNISSIKEEHINHFVYNLRKPLNFKSPKSVSPVLSLRDMYILKHKGSDVFDFYSAGIKKLHSRVGLENLKSVESKFYSIK